MFGWTDPEYVATNLLTNPGFETGVLTPWALWSAGGAPGTRAVIASAYAYEGAYEYQHMSLYGNSGSVQTISCYSGFTYALSLWAYCDTDAYPDIWMVGYNDSAYTHVHPTIKNTWQQISQNIITGQAQTTISMWIGGVGVAYFDLASITTSLIRVRFLDRIEFVPVDNTNNTRWTVTLAIEEA
jgi:hypothetical protein